MSSRKRRSKKQGKRSRKKVQKSPRLQVQKSLVKPGIWSKSWVTAILFAVPYIWMIVNFFLEYPDHPTRNSELINIYTSFPVMAEIIVFSIIIFSFGYFALKILKVFASSRRADITITILGFLALVTLYFLAFTEELLPNGDNAEYLMITKSLVEEGAAYRLNTYSETPNTLASLGLPLVLSPIYILWGFDLVKMKIVVVCMGLALFPLLITLFRNYISLYQAILIAMMAMLSPHLLAASSTLMTETPYLFWSVITLLLLEAFSKSGFQRWIVPLFLLLSLTMTYLTRAIGITMVMAMVVHLFFQIPWRKFIQTRDWQMLKQDPRFRQFVWLAVPIGVLAIAWQFYLAITNVSQADVFFRSGIYDRFYLNLDTSIRVIAQMIFSVDTYLWYVFFGNYQLSPLNFWWWLVLLCLFTGILKDLGKNNIISWYTVFCYIVVLFASITPAEMVIIRYLSILVPFFIFFIYEGSALLVRSTVRLTRRTISPKLVQLIPLLIMAQLLFCSLSSDMAVITRSASGQGPNYQDYIEVAKWSKENLPKDAFVICVKPRIYWFYSDRKTHRSTTISEVYSEEYEIEKLEHWRKQGATHLVIDRISAASRQNIIPIIENNPDLFQTLFVAPTSGTTSILKINFE